MTVIIIFIIIGILAGVLSGLVGVGGGVLIVPLLVFLMGYTQHQAQGMSLAILLPPVTLLAVLNYNDKSAINWKMALVASLLFILGAYIGSKIAISIDQKLLKKIFGVLLLIISMKFLFGEYFKKFF